MNRFDFLKNNSLLERLHRHALAAERYYDEEDYEICAIKCRKTLDLTIQLMLEYYGKYSVGDNLKDMVEFLVSKDCFTRDEYNSILTIINIGNQAVHTDIDINSRDAKKVLASLSFFLHELNDTVYSEYSNIGVGERSDWSDIASSFLQAEQERLAKATKAVAEEDGTAGVDAAIQDVSEKEASQVEPSSADKVDTTEQNAIISLSEMGPEGLLAEGWRYYKGKDVVRDMKQVVKYWTAAAKKGYLEAQFALAAFYEDDFGGRQNYQKAKEWYAKAAEQGHIEAQYKLGYFFENGYGGKQSYREARKWYERAAAQQHAEAQYRLGIIYEHGYKVKRNHEMAINWFKSAAAQGNEQARGLLQKWQLQSAAEQKDSKPLSKEKKLTAAEKYEEGRRLLSLVDEYICAGLSNRTKKAVYNYCVQALEYGCLQAELPLAECYYYGWGTKVDYEKACAIYKKHAAQGNVNSFCKLAICYEQGQGVMKDCQRAIHYYEKAARAHDVKAQYRLALYYEGTNDTPVDLEKMAYWYEQAAKNGHAEAQYRLGLCYEKGTGVGLDLSKAVFWFERADANGVTTAAAELRYCRRRISFNKLLAMAEKQKDGDLYFKVACEYESGSAVTMNHRKAMEWYQKAAETGHAEAQYRLGKSYEMGMWVEKDGERAVALYKQAIAQGYLTAEFALGYFYLNGLGGRVDVQEGLKWWHSAATKGFDVAQRNIGELYFNGHLVTQNYEEAVKWFSLAAAQGDARATFALGKCYAEGKGVPRDTHKAKRLLEKYAVRRPMPEHIKELLKAKKLIPVTC